MEDMLSKVKEFKSNPYFDYFLKKDFHEFIGLSFDDVYDKVFEDLIDYFLKKHDLPITEKLNVANLFTDENIKIDDLILSDWLNKTSKSIIKCLELIVDCENKIFTSRGITYIYIANKSIKSKRDFEFFGFHKQDILKIIPVLQCEVSDSGLISCTAKELNIYEQLDIEIVEDNTEDIKWILKKSTEIFTLSRSHYHEYSRQCVYSARKPSRVVVYKRKLHLQEYFRKGFRHEPYEPY